MARNQAKATRQCYIVNDKKYNEDGYLVEEQSFTFDFFSGFAASQKEKSRDSFHQEIRKKLGENVKILEISTKSNEPLGQALSAFNLQVSLNDNKKIPLECAYQGSKVFADGTQYDDLYFCKEPKNAKRDERIKEKAENNINIVKFNFDGTEFKTEPKTFFYEWLYIKALYDNHQSLAEQLIEGKFTIFTDIEFNPNKSLSNQARAVAIFVALYKLNLLEIALLSKEKFEEIVYKNNESSKKSFKEEQSLFSLEELLK